VLCTAHTPHRSYYASNFLLTVHTSCHLNLQHHNSYNRTVDGVGSPDDGHKDARNMLRCY